MMFRLHHMCADHNHEQTSSNEDGYRLIVLASSNTGAVIAPKAGGGIAVDQSEFEQADTAKRAGPRAEGPLISYRLRNLGLRRGQQKRQPRSDPQRSSE